MIDKSSKDPLEAAKETPKPKTRTRKMVETKAVAKEVPAPPKVPVVEEVTEPALDPTEYVVQRKIKISWGAQMLRFAPGKIITEALYGPGSIQKLRDAGVALEPMKKE